MNKFAITSWFKDVAGKFARDEEGAQVVEYALIIAVVSIGLVIALSTLLEASAFTTFMTRVTACLGTATCT